MDNEFQKLQTEINLLKQRNVRVESDKAWETSWTRMFTIALFTYIVALALLSILGSPFPLLAALIPAIGFAFSTFTLPYLKRVWTKRRTLDE